MNYIFKDNKIVDNQIARCRLYEFGDVRGDFKTDIFIFEIVVHKYGLEFLQVEYSNLEFLFEDGQGRAIRKAIEKFDQFCNGWFDS